MTPSQKISATADAMVAEDLHGWQQAVTILTDRHGWNGGAIRIAAVQADQLAQHRRQGGAA